MHRIVALVLCALASSACVVEEHRTYGGSSGGAAAEPAPDVPPAEEAPSGPVAPMLVDIDTDEQMNASPGQGVGVFIEYYAGGHWRVWWTCDTAITSKTCAFEIGITAGSGEITNTKPQELATAGNVQTVSSRQIKVTTITGSQTHGVRFDTPAGAVITVDAAVGSLRDGKYFFFVQNGKINGGFKGKLTNPLMLQGKTP
jgi:hypothetical protein